MAGSNLPPPLVITSDASYVTEFHAALYSLQQSASLTDFTIRSGCASIACHRVVLAAASPYFSAMFATRLSEENTGEVALDFDVDSLKILIEYMYTGTVSVEYNNVKHVVCAADYLLMPLVKEKCEDYLVEHVQLHVENCLGWCKFGTRYGLNDLVEKAKELMRSKFNAVIESEEFLHLSLADLVDYIKMDNLNILYEDLKLLACLDWIKHDPVKRKPDFNDLLQHMSIQNVSISFLNDIIQQNKGIIAEATANKMSQDILDHLARTEHGYKPEDKEKQNTYIILLGGDNSSNIISKPGICDSTNYVWKNLASFPNAGFRGKFSMCILDGGILVMGGTPYISIASKDSFFYHATFNGWIKVSDMLTSRYSHGSIAINKYAYVLGGKGEDQFALSRVEMFDMMNDKWQVVQPMLHAPGQAPIVTRCSHEIFVVVSDLNAFISKEWTMQIYNTVRDKWTLGPPLPDHITSTFGASAITYNDDIYLIGGSQKICSKYSTKTQTWSSLTSPQHIQNYGATVFFSGKIHVLGGSSSNKWTDYSDTIAEYDIEDDDWKVLDCKCPHKFTSGIALVMSKPADFLDKF